MMVSTRVANLVMLDALNREHGNKDITISKYCQTAWIINVIKLAKQICKSCLRCRFLKKLLENQKMSILPQELQVPAPPFTNVGIWLVPL